jgi:predicted  nucleic acid-binding Zn-ribbon protein
VQHVEKDIKTVELEVESIQTRIRDFQAKSAMIKSNDEYRAALQQIDRCQQDIRRQEDRELELMEALDAARKALREREKELAATRERVAAMTADLDQRGALCREEMEKLAAERDAAGAEVPPDMRQKYERLRGNARFLGRVFVPARDGFCDGCHMHVTYQARVDVRKGLLVSCQNCGVLLYADE